MNRYLLQDDIAKYYMAGEIGDYAQTFMNGAEEMPYITNSSGIEIPYYDSVWNRVSHVISNFSASNIPMMLNVAEWGSNYPAIQKNFPMLSKSLVYLGAGTAAVTTVNDVYLCMTDRELETNWQKVTASVIRVFGNTGQYLIGKSVGKSVSTGNYGTIMIGVGGGVIGIPLIESTENWLINLIRSIDDGNKH